MQPNQQTLSKLPVYTVEHLQMPCLFGLFRPAIYVPENMTDHTTLSMILAHEQSHYHQKDHIWALFRSICLCLHWYNPLVWIAARLSRHDSELACDERTVHGLGEESRTAYGKVLIALSVEKSKTGDFLCCATSLAADKKSMKERISLLAKKPHMAITSFCAMVLIVAAAVGISFTGTKEESAGVRDAVSETDKEDGNSDVTDREEINTSDRADNSDQSNGDLQTPDRSQMPDYMLIESTTIDNDYFTMTVPEEMIGKVGYQIYPAYDEDGTQQEFLVKFVLDSIATTVMELDGSTRLKEDSMGILGGISWSGLREYEGCGLWEELLLASGEADYRKIDTLYREYYGFGIEGDPVDFNSDETGAYGVWNPSDVQWDPLNANEERTYLYYDEKLVESLLSFRAKKYPYDTWDTAPYEVLLDFLRAEEVLSWFYGYGEPECTYGEDLMLWSEDGKVYYLPVTQYGITTMEQLQTYMGRYFSNDTIQQLMENPRMDGYASFIEQDGILYHICGGVGLYSYLDGDADYTVVFSDDNSQQAKLTVHSSLWTNMSQDAESGDVTDEYTCRMEQGTDGTWRIAGEPELVIERLIRKNS